MSKKDRFEGLEEGDFILFNDRKQPLEVVSAGETVVVRGPRGGEYSIFYSKERGLRVSKKGSRRYSSYVKDIRKTGHWEKMSENLWKHTGTGAVIEILKKGTGLWNIRTEGFNPDVEIPQYGFTEKDFAEENVKKILRKHAEGS